MYAGRIVERGPVRAIFRDPQHPYTIEPAARRAAAGRPAPAARARSDPRQRAQPVRHARGMQLPSALRVLHGGPLRRGAAETRRGRRESSCAPATAMADARPVAAADGVLLEVRDLKVHFPRRHSRVLAPVGRRRARRRRRHAAASGAARPWGWSARADRARPPSAAPCCAPIEPTAGRVIFHRDGAAIDVTALDRRGLRSVWQHMQMVFQDPYASLNPRMTVRDIIGEPLIAHRLARGKALEQRVADIAGRCGLGIEHLGRYPHAFSGGQRQRIAIARALVAAAGVRRLRRAGLRARRLDPGTDPQPAAGAAARARAGLSLHLPRSRGGRLCQRPGGGDVSRARSSSWRRPRSSTTGRSIPIPRR